MAGLIIGKKVSCSGTSDYTCGVADQARLDGFNNYDRFPFILQEIEKNALKLKGSISVFPSLKRTDTTVLSWSGWQAWTAEPEDVLERVCAKNMLLIAALGNDGIDVTKNPRKWFPVADPPELPSGCKYDPVLRVASVRWDAGGKPKLAPYSNFGKIDVLAPGGGYNMAVPGTNFLFDYYDSNIKDQCLLDKEEANGGTSQATAVTAGLIALLLKCNPLLSPSEIRDKLIQTSDQADIIPSGSGTFLSGNILNFERAIDNVCVENDL